MAIKKRTVAALVSANPVNLGQVGLGAKYAKLLGFRARNWGSSAKAGAGTDTAVRVSITDNNSDVVYLDAADVDYATAEKTYVVAQDDTSTGLGTTAVDATGAAASAGAGIAIVMESPVTVAIVNGTTATDYFEISLIVEV